MTLTLRDDARREIQKDVDALTQHPKYFNVKVERAKTYFPTIERIFAEEHLPDDFKYLSLQESALVPDAVSVSNAVGFWQFKDFTAREMGLRVDSEVDESMHIASASRGAARYLKQGNHFFNNWIYALQAYQMGAGGVMRLVGDTDLGVRHMEITTDTYWYVKKFLAHKVAFENAVSGKPTVEIQNLRVAGGLSWEDIAKKTSTDEQKLREFNKWLKTDKIPMDKEYAVVIPTGESVIDFGVLVVAGTQPKPSSVVTGATEEKIEVNGVPAIRARKGETLAVISGRGNIGIAAFLRNNEMSIDKAIEEGQLYFLQKKKKHAAEELYTLKSGDDLWIVSQRFAVLQKSLRRLNRLNAGARVSPGETLFLKNRKPAGIDYLDGQAVALLDENESFSWDTSIRRNDKQNSEKTNPLASDSPAAQNETKNDGTVNKENEVSIAIAGMHEVKPSDTLYSVSRQYGVTIKELIEWNDKKDFSLTVGEKLKVRSH